MGTTVLETRPLVGRRWRGVMLPTPTATEAGRRNTVRVCFIAPSVYGFFRPDSGASGSDTALPVFLLCRELSADRQFRVSILTFVDDDAGVERYGSIRLLKCRLLRRTGTGGHGGGHASGGSLRRLATNALGLGRILHALDADLYVYAGSSRDAGLYALICRLLRRRYVVMPARVAAPRRGEAVGYRHRLSHLGIRAADAVVCWTRSLQKRCLVQHGRRGLLIRAGLFPPPVVQDQKHVVLWVGRLEDLAQPQLFLALAERLEGERCQMVLLPGSDEGELARAVRARLTGLPNVTLHEDVPWGELGAFLGQAKLLIHTATREDLPTLFIQAAMHRTPILSWRADPDGILNRDRCGICVQGSWDRLLESALELCGSEPSRAALGERAWRYARSAHDLHASVEQFKSVVRRVSDAPGGRGIGRLLFW